MATFERHVEVNWQGGLVDGRGEAKAGTGAFDLPVTFASRIGEPVGKTSPEELMAAAETEAAKILQSARKEVENRLKSARHELTEYAGQLASDRAMAILKEKITDADQKKLFEESLREVGEAKA